jgi:hypothetical protein
MQKETSNAWTPYILLNNKGIKHINFLQTAQNL